MSINDDYDSLINKDMVNRLDISSITLLYDHMAYGNSEKIQKILKIQRRSSNKNNVFSGY